MAKKEGSTQTQQQGGPAVGALPNTCLSEGCKQKSNRLNFCNEHYEWFKQGLLTKEGQMPKDFDKKYINYMKHKKKSAA